MKKLITLTTLLFLALSASAQHLGPNAYTIPNWTVPSNVYQYNQIRGEYTYRPADYNKNKSVGTEDLATFLSDWQDANKGIFNARSDFNEDGKISIADYSFLGATWGYYTPIRSADIYMAVTPTFAYALDTEIVVCFWVRSYWLERSSHQWYYATHSGFQKIPHNYILEERVVKYTDQGGGYIHTIWLKIPKGNQGVFFTEQKVYEGFLDEVSTGIMQWNVPVSTINPINLNQ